MHFSKRSGAAWLGSFLFLLCPADIRGQVGTKLWEFRGNSPFAPGAALDEDGTIYVANSSNLTLENPLMAVRRDGTLKWSVSLPGDEGGVPVIGPDGVIYVATTSYEWSHSGAAVYSNRALTDLNAVSSAGKTLWSTRLPSTYGGALGVAKSGAIYMANHWLVSAFAPDGSMLWTNAYARLPNDGGINAPTISEDGTIYLTGGDSFVALDSTGAKKWEITVLSGPWSHPAIGSDGALYVGRGIKLGTSEYGGRICSFNPDGTLRWQFPTDGIVSASPVLGRDGRVYAACTDGYLYALNPDGTLNWAFPTGSKALGAPVVDADENVYFQTENTKVHALNAMGVLQWVFQVAYAPMAFSPALSPDGVLYVGGGGNGRLYALQAGAGLSASPWPTIHGNSRRSGQSEVPTVVPSGKSRPRITTDPRSQLVPAGSPLVLEVLVESIDPVTYQWRREGYNIPGATNRSFSIPNVALADQGRYALIAYNSAGSVSSREAEVAVIPRLVAPAQPLELRGWNLDVVMENKSTPASFGFEVPVPIQKIDDPIGARFFEAGLEGQVEGLPPSRQIPSSVQPDVLFSLQPYDANNVLKLFSLNHSATLTLVKPERYASLHVLAASALWMGGLGRMDLHFADGGTHSNIPFLAKNWFDPSAKMGISGLRAVQPSNGSLEFLVRETTAALHQTDLDLVAMGLSDRVLTAITFTRPIVPNGSLITGILAVSGLPTAEASRPRIGVHLDRTSGEVELMLHNAGSAPVIEVSTDCIHWSALTDHLRQLGSGRVVDPDTRNRPMRFYRIAP